MRSNRLIGSPAKEADSGSLVNVADHLAGNCLTNEFAIEDYLGDITQPVNIDSMLEPH